MSLLLDTGFLYALLNRTEQNHTRVAAITQQINETVILPVPAITQVAYLLLRDVGPTAVADFIATLCDHRSCFGISCEPGLHSCRRGDSAIQPMRVDFVDALIVAMAERLSVSRILTLDVRHFAMFRPIHCQAFELLP